MKLGYASLFLYALAMESQASKSNLRSSTEVGVAHRGLATKRKKILGQNHWDEELDQCTGAVCGLWGDPHMITCDGVAFDCNARGLKKIMSNDLFTMQGHYIDVNSRDMDRLTFKQATFLNDAVIHNKVDDTVIQVSIPLMQHVQHANGVPEAYTGCFAGYIYEPIMAKYTGDSLEECKARCEAKEGCRFFTHYVGGMQCCYLHDENAKLVEKGETNTGTTTYMPYAGPIDKCAPEIDYTHGTDTAEWKAAKFVYNGSKNKDPNGDKSNSGPKCPLNIYIDGTLIDVSDYGDEQYFFGDENSAHSGKFTNYNEVIIKQTTPEGGLAEFMIEMAGNGPGKQWSCHINMFACLPETDKQTYIGTSDGLWGNTDGDPQDDWKLEDGTLWIDYVKNNGSFDSGDWNGNLPKIKNKQEAFEYCEKSWCVSEEDSLMVYPNGKTYEDFKCYEEDYHEDNSCSAEDHEIAHFCDQYKHVNSVLYRACELDCCLGGCADFDPPTLMGDDDGIDTVEPECEDDNFGGTGDLLCPPHEIVKLEHSTAAIPQGQPIIYDIVHRPLEPNFGQEVSFRVENPFQEGVNAYVRYEKKVGYYANDPACDGFTELPGGCAMEDPVITVGCVEFPGVAPFAMVDVYFTAGFLPNDGTEVEKCCPTEDDAGVGVVKYSFKIQCACPDDS